MQPQYHDARGELAPLPRHLDLDAPPVAHCTDCGRRLWDAWTVEQPCRMPQPDGRVCPGTFAVEAEGHFK